MTVRIGANFGLVDIEGDLAAPRLEATKHDAYMWVGLDNVELMMEGRGDCDRRLLEIVVKALQLPRAHSAPA